MINNKYVMLCYVALHTIMCKNQQEKIKDQQEKINKKRSTRKDQRSTRII